MSASQLEARVNSVTLEFMPDNKKAAYRQVSTKEAITLLRNYTRDPSAAVLRLLDNPYGQLNCEGGRIRYNPSKPEV